MPQTPDLTKYLDAGAEFVSITRAQARRRAKELVSQGQLAQDQVQGFIDGLVEGSRRRTDLAIDVVRHEIQRQVQSVGIATKDDLVKLEAKLAKQQAKVVKKVSGSKSGSTKDAKTKKTKKPKQATGTGTATNASATKKKKSAKRATTSG